MKISLSANELRLSDSPLLSNYFPAAWNYYSKVPKKTNTVQSTLAKRRLSAKER